nr:RNA-directed DNA polymerase, eukaryota [Tanacetum cinerariifolium]
MVLTPKDKEGLWVSSLYALNRGLMIKWVWRFYFQKNSLWTIVIKAIYGEDGNLNKLGNGDNTRFWIDNWYEGGVIKDLFPRMFALETNKNASVSLKLNAPNLDNSFRRQAKSGIEVMQLNSLAEISRITTLVPCEDHFVWTLEGDGVFSVASIRKKIDGNRFQDVCLPTRWVKSVHIKALDDAANKEEPARMGPEAGAPGSTLRRSSQNCIGGNMSKKQSWKEVVDKVLSRLSRWKMNLLSIGEEFVHAGPFKKLGRYKIMRKISSWWNVDYSDVNSYEEWRVWLVSIRIQSKLKGILEGVYFGLWWYMWNFRDKLLFDKKIPEKAVIFHNLVSSSFYWCKFRCKVSFKWDDWLKNPYIVLV